MAGSLLRSFISGTRQVLTVQLIVSIAAIALAGWTLGVTGELIRERDRLRARVIQLEQTMGGSGVVVPETPVAVVDEPAPTVETVYPGAVGPIDPAASGEAAAAEDAAPEAAAAEQRDLGTVLGSLFTPPPPLRLVVMHVRAEGDTAQARRLAEAMDNEELRVIVDVMAPRDPRASGYIYFDGRQSRAAAALVTQVHDLARELEIAPWSAQLRGVALPAQGEYTADRVDLVLPPLPTETAARAN